MKKLWLLVLLLLVAGPARAQIAFDTATSAPGTASTLTYSHTCNGANRLLIVGVSAKSAGITVNGVTYAGVAMTSVGTAVMADVLIHMWSLIAPTTGANDVVVTLSGAPLEGVVSGAVSFTGADQTTPTGTFASSTGTGTAPSVAVTSASGEIVIDTVGIGAGTLTAGAGQTARWNLSQTHTGAGSTEAGAASVTMSWTGSVADDWAIGGVSCKPAAGGAAPAGFNKRQKLVKFGLA